MLAVESITLPVRSCIFLAWTIQPAGFLSALCHKACHKAVGHRLLCRVLAIGVVVGGVFGAVANASAGITLRVTLATAGLPSIEAPDNLQRKNLQRKNLQRQNSQTKQKPDGLAVQQTAVQQTAAHAAAQAKAAAQAQLRVKVKALVKVYAAKSDKELTAMSAQWQELPRLDQQVLLREVKMRMARQRGRKGSVQIRTERRFGRLLRQADGSVVRVETRVVQVRPATKGEQASQVQVRKSGYGTGFGRRAVQGSVQDTFQHTTQETIQEDKAASSRPDAQPEPQTERRPAPQAKP